MDSKTKERKPRDDTVAPSSALTYLDPHYWNDRFGKEEHYEWLKDYSHFRHLISDHIHPNFSVLELGCGNSQLSDEMYKDGIKNVTCTDLSPIAVDNVQKRLLFKGYKVQPLGKSDPNMQFTLLDRRIYMAMVADMLNLPFTDDTFDVVIEKGTMDVLFVDSGDPWNPKAETVSKVMAMLEGIHRVLKPDGIFISISFGQPHFRRPIFEAPSFTWSMKWDAFGDGFHYFFYTLKKGTRSLNNNQPSERVDFSSIRLLQDELEGEDFMFRTNFDDM